ncbi:MAG TPA: hypothetical protein VGH94_00840, partial [Acidimicrobiales bacterium]
MELFGFTNIPYGLWVDEGGTIVRPADVAFGPRVERPARADGPQDEERRRQRAEARREAEARMTPEQREAQQGMLVNVDLTGRYVEAVRDWAAKGADSEYSLTPDQVVERSRPRPPEFG